MDRQPGWDETDSHDFIDHGRFFVPEREEQIAAVLDVIPDPGDGLLVDLCCGEGLLSRGLLERFPRARVLALDLSPAMLAQARVTCAAVSAGLAGRRVSTPVCSISRTAPGALSRAGPRFVSSLAIHTWTARASASSSATSAAASLPEGPW